VVSSSPSPQGDVGSKLIVAKVVTFNGGKWDQSNGKVKAFKKPNLNLSFMLFCCLLCFQKIYHYIQVSIMKTEQKK